eukprot:TRINITY_DN49625_c0_g1_i1.p1 TRINITY_DN49625_c0_g1~~TRINITY_DN49625_c0_g1_i1.p1  ORF type:complete len:365 (-),score=42.20 TRINITY_DN49625_c0_g1_i1:121-1152(-)
MSKLSFSVVTYNTFCGTPWGFVELERFRQQALLLRQEAPDVICLQELFSDRVLDCYREVLEEDYEFFRDVAQGRWKLLRWLGRLLGSLSVCGAFLFGSTQGGLLVLVRRKSRLRLTDHSYRDFLVQGGDFLNRMRPRGYMRCKFLACLSEPDPTAGLSPLEGPKAAAATTSTSSSTGPLQVTLVNTHTNAYPTRSPLDAAPIRSEERILQLREAFDRGGADDLFLGVGDLNTNYPEDDEVPTEEFGLLDADPNGAPTLPLTPMLKQVFRDTKGDLRSDYQFYSDGSKPFLCQGFEADLLKKQLSDHGRKAIMRPLRACVLAGEFGALSDHRPLRVDYELAYSL